MRLGMEQHLTPASIANGSWTLALVGQEVDARGAAALAFASTRARRSHTIVFDPNEQSLYLDGASLTLDGLDLLVRGHRVLIETTTLGFVEVFLSLRACKAAAEQPVSMIYAEPSEYSAPGRYQPLGKRDFELTDKARVFSAVPTAGLLLNERDPVRAVFFLGYEGSRLSRILEEVGVQPANCALVFGVPAFQAGWEMNSFANNIDPLFDNRIPIIEYAGAQNPMAAYEVLDRIHKGCEEGRLLIAPIGTKPHGIAAALYACTHEGIGLTYDYPVKRRRRSDALSTWHLFEVVF